MHIDSPGFARSVWQRLRRPSTLVLIGAGLLAADRLRWLPPAWTDATLFAAAGLTLTLGLGFVLLGLRRPRRRREVQVVVLPLNRDAPLLTTLQTGVRPLFIFLLFVLALVLIPAAFAAVLS